MVGLQLDYVFLMSHNTHICCGSIKCFLRQTMCVTMGVGQVTSPRFYGSNGTWVIFKNGLYGFVGGDKCGCVEVLTVR